MNNITFNRVESLYVKEVFTKTVESFSILHGHPLVLCKRNIKNTTMQAQPIINRHIFNQEKRAYRIDFSEKTQIHQDIMVKDLPEDVLAGWFAHELGHVVDYQKKSPWDLIKFGLKYILFDHHKIEAERKADFYAVKYGFQHEITVMKEYIINHADIDPIYKSRIRKYYLGPEEVEHLVNEIQQL